MKSTIAKRGIAALLCTVLAAGAVSCGAETAKEPVATEKKPQETQNAASVTETEETTEEELVRLPKDLDYEERKVNVYGWNTYEDVEFDTEAENGEIVNDAVFQRNRAVEERLNVELFFDESIRDDWGGTIRSIVQAGDSSFDIVAGHSGQIAILTNNLALCDLLQYDYLDFSQPWWRQELTNHATILGHLFFATGDLSPSSVARTQALFVNCNILREFDYEDPYEMVVNGTWTLDKLFEMATGVYYDLNSDGKKNDLDRFGFVMDGIQTQAIGLSHGIITMDTDKETGRLVVSDDFYSERTLNVLDRWCNFMLKNNDVWQPAMDDCTIFREGRSLFYVFPLALISSEFRDCQFDIDFVPFPKVDEAQDRYYTCTSNAYSLWSIPLSAGDPEMSAAVMEDLCYEGYTKIMPALFEVAYKVKYNQTGSELQSEVFDILRSSLVFDIGRLINPAGKIFSMFPDCVNSGHNTMASRYEKVIKSCMSKVDDWMDELEDWEG